MDPDGRQEEQIAIQEELLSLLGRYADTWESTEASIVTAYYILVETATTDGMKALIEIPSTNLPAHLRMGMLHSALFDEWPESE